jgi:Domain of unknown function (DUF4173)
MSVPAVPAVSGRPAAAPLDPFGRLWPESDLPPRPRVAATALAVGLLAALVLPERDHGLGYALVALAVGTSAFALAPPRPFVVLSFALAVPLASMSLVRDAGWIDVLCLLAAGAVGCVALVDARSVPAMVASFLAPPLAGLRGLPWLGRTLHSVGGLRASSTVWPVLRTTALSVFLVGVFGALFATADAVFARWADAVVPDLTVDKFVARLVVLAVVAGVTLAASYVALNPPRVDRLHRTATPVSRTFEWLVPVALVIALYVGFVVAQATVMFGGHDYLRRTTGLTYAEHVHQGFGQLTVATLLTLGVVATAARKAPRTTVRERLLLRVALGVLCALTLVVVASALYRMHVYEQAYGFTVLRVLVSVFEGWLGLVVLLVLAAGLRLDGWWLPRAVVLSGASALLALAAVNPEGYVAERNVERYLETGKADWSYLAGLSSDAVPALRQLPAAVQPCVFAGGAADDDGWLEWNLGRARAGDDVLGAGGCTP